MRGRLRRFPPARGRSRGIARKGRLRRLADYLLIPAFLVLLALFSTRMEEAGTARLSGSALVHDGDTLTLAGERLRLRGIDAPELSQTCRRNGLEYACGRRAREALETLIAGRALSCSGRQRDRYERLLVTCTAGRVEINRAMVEQGWALAYGGYAAAESRASARGVGLWAGPFERPQEWRVRHGGMVEAEHDPLPALWDWLWEFLRFS